MEFIVKNVLSLFTKPCELTERKEFIDIYGNKKDIWTIDINTMEELIKFEQKNGELTIYADSLYIGQDGVKRYCIEIYHKL